MTFIVTGGSRGIGAEVVLQAVKAGFDVAFTFVKNRDSADAVIERASTINREVRCKAYQVDASSSEQVDTFRDQVLKDFDSVSVVVSNAGINDNCPVMSMTDEQWDQVLKTNLYGAFYFSRAFLPTFLAERNGRFVFLSSLSKDGLTGQANYAASKAGLLGLSCTLAKEYGKRGITSNVVAPGMIKTDMSRDNMSSSQGEFWEKYSPVQRVGNVEEVAAAVMFFASENASYINGTCLPVTSGLDWAP